MEKLKTGTRENGREGEKKVISFPKQKVRINYSSC